MNIKKREKGITEGDPMEIFVNGGDIILKKYNPGCTFCGSLEDVHIMDNIKICKKCAEKIAKAVK
jgi:transcriptional pleiotropic regulator of transition state genes